ncbi:complement C3-like [Stegostoma tigrinum]|uniref:complement C3-like n=1 Tax=Stegostoma tigrinum TaxID=3053191 RepID=UPI00286FC373|nr:complement C3-like [Stegostoma tigrinum]
MILMSVTGKPPLLEDEKPYPIEAAQASAMTVEITAYALLQALSRNDIDYATPIARWLTMQQNDGGGIHSTQDTIIALEASSRYYFAFLKREEEINMQIQFHGFGSPIENTIHLRRHNALTEKELKFPLGRKIHIKLTGQGNGTLTGGVSGTEKDVSLTAFVTKELYRSLAAFQQKNIQRFHEWCLFFPNKRTHH